MNRLPLFNTFFLSTTVGSVSSMLLLLMTPLVTANPSQEGWVFCSDEFFTCEVPVPALVRYGATFDGIDQYAYQTVDHTVACHNNVFGNPVDVRKRCDYQLSDVNDHDQDGVVDRLDVFPANPNESHDSDNDGLGDNSDPFPSDASNQQQADWIHCADEWFTCTAPVPALVRYGVEANGEAHYAYQSATDTLWCSNYVFGNPLNTRKHCDYLLSDTADYDGDGVVDSLDAFPNNSAEFADTDGDGIGDNSDPFPQDSTNQAAANWVFCSDEWFVCNLPVTALVRYGAVVDGEAQYTYQTLSDTILCNNNTFGNPAKAYKHCDYLLSDTTDYDGDGVVDSLDPFPNNSAEFADTDGDGIGDNSDPFPEDSSNQNAENWVFCSEEFFTCTVPENAWVRYGAVVDGQAAYYYQAVDSTSIACNNQTFGNPANARKQCHYLVITVDPQTLDADLDGVADADDAFPNDPLQSQDIDGNGVGDNTPSSQAVAYTYNSFGQILTVDGPRTDVDDITTYGYNSNYYLSSISNALGHITQLQEHNGRGQPQVLIDANGTSTTLSYHIRGWLLSSRINHPSDDESLASTTTYAYDNVGNIIQTTLPNGTTIYYHYDTSNRLIAVSNNANERIDYTLDNAGNRLSERISDGSATITYQMTRAYDELSRVMEIIGANNQVTEVDYDVNDNAVQSINPRQYATQHQYDALDRLTQSTDANNGTTQYTYDNQDRLISVTDANGNTTTYQYDAFDNLIEQHSPDTGTTRHAYDNAGNRIASVDSRGVVTTYIYDALNRLTAVNYPLYPEENIQYQYDVTTYTTPENQTLAINGIGRLFSISDQSGQQFYAYDHQGRVTSHVRSIGADATLYWTDYVYNNISQQLSQTQHFLPNGDLSYVTHYEYDNLGRVEGINYQTTSGGTQHALVSQLQYLPFGGVTQLTYGNGITTQVSYDQDYRLTQYQTQGDSSTLLNRSYSYDANSNITQIDHLQTTNFAQDFGYDPLDRLDSSQTPLQSLAWVYDPVGNRLSENADTYDYDLNSNILLNLDGDNQNTAYTVDAKGNTTRITQGSDITSFDYNAANRPSSITKDGITTEYTYNALGQRTSKRQGTNTIHYIYNLAGVLVAEYQDGQPLVEYIYLGNQPLAQLRNGEVYTYHNDHLGTPQVLMDENQQVVWQANYSAFGKAAVTTEVITNNIRGLGQYLDIESNLHYNLYRFYNPETGRFPQADPRGIRLDFSEPTRQVAAQMGISIYNSAGNELNHSYNYANQNPLMYTDPTGEAGLFGSAIGGTLGFGSSLIGSVATGGWDALANPEAWAAAAVSGAAGLLSGFYGDVSGGLRVTLARSAIIGGGSNLAGQTVGLRMDENSCNNFDYNYGSLAGSILGSAWAGVITRGAGQVSGAVIGTMPSTATGALGTELGR